MHEGTGSSHVEVHTSGQVYKSTKRTVLEGVIGPENTASILDQRWKRSKI
jgi:hypothetical protein